MMMRGCLGPPCPSLLPAGYVYDHPIFSLFVLPKMSLDCILLHCFFDPRSFLCMFFIIFSVHANDSEYMNALFKFDDVNCSEW